MNLDIIRNLPLYQKVVALILIMIIIVAIFFYFLYLPKRNQIVLLQNEISKLQNEININMTKARRLEDLKRENAELERQLLQKKEQLPPEAEVASLLKQVTDLGLRVGLDFKLWRPAPKKTNPSGLYLEIPVDVEIAGNYHTVATFFDRVGKLPRIVNIGNLRMSNPRVDKGSLIVQTTFVATAFAAAEEKPPETPSTQAPAGRSGGAGLDQ
jgi:type IV pilus assembly protein PilO